MQTTKYLLVSQGFCPGRSSGPTSRAGPLRQGRSSSAQFAHQPAAWASPERAWQTRIALSIAGVSVP